MWQRILAYLCTLYIYIRILAFLCRTMLVTVLNTAQVSGSSVGSWYPTTRTRPARKSSTMS